MKTHTPAPPVLYLANRPYLFFWIVVGCLLLTPIAIFPFYVFGLWQQSYPENSPLQNLAFVGALSLLPIAFGIYLVFFVRDHIMVWNARVELDSERVRYRYAGRTIEVAWDRVDGFDLLDKGLLFLPIVTYRSLTLWQGGKKLLVLDYKIKGFVELARLAHFFWCRDIDAHRRWLAQVELPLPQIRRGRIPVQDDGTLAGRYKAMSEADFAALCRDDLTEEAQETYDRERTRRSPSRHQGHDTEGDDSPPQGLRFQIDRNASGQLWVTIPNLPGDAYADLAKEVIAKFRLKGEFPVIGLDEVFMKCRKGDLRVGIEWDIWSGFIVEAADAASEPLVLEIYEFLQARCGSPLVGDGQRLGEYVGTMQGDLLGWREIIAAMEEKLAPLAVSEVEWKEKWGVLRVDYDFTGSEEEELAVILVVAEAEQRSAVTCEFCGRSGELVKVRGWLKTLCSPCLVKAISGSTATEVYWP